jgi:hypothetical protein
MVLVLTGSGYVVGSGVCTFAVATPVGTFDSAYAIAIACTSAAVITRFAASVGVTMFVAAGSRSSAIGTGAAAAFIVIIVVVIVVIVVVVVVFDSNKAFGSGHCCGHRGCGCGSCGQTTSASAAVAGSL